MEITVDEISAVFEKWVEKFWNFEPMRMGSEHTKTLIALLLRDEKNIDFSTIENTFEYRLIDKRSAHIGLVCTKKCITMLSIMCQSPGDAVMYLYAIRSKVTHADIDTLCELFPDGFPSGLHLHQMWDYQKGYTHKLKMDNILDKYTFGN